MKDRLSSFSICPSDFLITLLLFDVQIFSCLVVYNLRSNVSCSFFLYYFSSSILFVTFISLFPFVSLPRYVTLLFSLYFRLVSIFFSFPHFISLLFSFLLTSCLSSIHPFPNIPTRFFLFPTPSIIPVFLSSLLNSHFHFILIFSLQSFFYPSLFLSFFFLSFISIFLHFFLLHFFTFDRLTFLSIYIFFTFLIFIFKFKYDFY